MYVKLGGQGEIRQLNSCREWPEMFMRHALFYLVNA